MKKLLSLFLTLVMLVSVFAGLSTTALAAQPGDIWVDPVHGSDTNSGDSSSPLKTIDAAKTKAAAASADRDVTVWLKDGTYSVTEAIEFTSADSGKNGHTITYKAAPGASPVISGGKDVDGWVLHDADKNIYVADVPEGAVNSRQFYVDGEHQTRAMTETSPSDWTIYGAKGYMSPYSKTQDTEEELKLDLGEKKKVSYLTIYTGTEADTAGKAAGFPQDFTIQTSENGESWTTVHTETGYAAPSLKRGICFEFEAVTARYVKLNVTKLGTPSKTNTGKYMLAVSELETGFKGSQTDVSVQEQQIDYTVNRAHTLDFLGHDADPTWNTLTNKYGSDVHPAENLFDGDTTTYVSTIGHWKTWLPDGGGNNKLKAVVDVSSEGAAVELAAVSMVFTDHHHPTHFTLEYTSATEPTENDWTVLTEQLDFQWTNEYTLTYVFAPVKATKVRLCVMNLTDGAPNGGNGDGYDYYLRLAEFGAYSPADKNAAAPVEIDYENNLLRNATADNVLFLGYTDGTTDSAYVHGGTPVAQMFDGNAGTFVSTGGFVQEWLAGFGGGLTIKMDVSLGATAAQVGAIRLTPRAEGVGRPTDFVIQTSADGKTWQTVVTKTDYDWTADGADLFTFTPTNAKQIRFLIEKTENPESGNYFFQLAELAVFGVKTSMPSYTHDDDLLKSATADNVLFLGHTDGTTDSAYVHGGTPVAQMFDDNAGTVVSTGGYVQGWLAGFGGSLTIKMDVSLGATAVQVGAIRLTPRAEGVGRPTDFVIQTSADGNTWKTVVTKTDYDWTADGADLFTFTATNAKQIRFLIEKTENPEGDNYFFQLAELAVYPGVAASTGEPAGRVFYIQPDASQKYTVETIEALHDNDSKTFNANQAVNGLLYENYTHYGYAVPESYDLKNFAHPEDLEINILRWWYHRILKTSGISADGTEIYLDQNRLASFQGSSYADRITWVENAYEFIDQPGEWYIDRSAGKIYYKAEGTMSGKTAVLPVTEQLLTFENCENVTFDGVKFAYTSWLVPNELGYVDAQSGTYEQPNAPWGDVAGAIETQSSTNIHITNSELCNLGGGGIRIGNGSVDCSITNNAIHDISSGGIWVGNNTGHSHNAACDPGTDVKGIVVRNNYVTRIGIDIFDSSAICVLYSSNTIIDHNEVCNTPYTGISLGWGWDWKNAPCTGNNTVSNNLVYDTGKTIHDGASFYSLGLQEGTKVYGNYFHHHSDGLNDKDSGMYTDEGSTGMELYNNVVGEGVYWWAKVWNANIKNCTWHDNYHAVEHSWNEGTNVTFTDNTYVENGDFSQYPEAQKIIDNAGLTDPSVKADVQEEIDEKHNISLTKYDNCEAYYFTRAMGLSSFSIPNQIGNTQYDRVYHQVTILMPAGTDVTALVGNFVAESGFTGSPASGSTQDFTNPVTYTFKSAKETITWTVKVKCDVVAGGELNGSEMTLDEAIAAPSDWTVPPTAVDGNGAKFASGNFSAYIGKRIPANAILEFDVEASMSEDDNNNWLGYALRMQDTGSMLGTMYHVCFKNGGIELQKWVGGARTMLIGTIEGFDPVYGDVENLYFTANTRHSIKTGAIDVEEGVRLFLYVDGNLVFDVIDADEPIDDGFFAMYPMTQQMTLYPFTNIQIKPVDFTELEAAVKLAEEKKAEDYTAESFAALTEALNAAKAVLADKDATQDEVDAALKDLNDATDGLVKKKPIWNPGSIYIPSTVKPSVWKNPYTDVSVNDSFYDAVKFVTEEEWMNGMSENRFAPYESLTRGMLVTILYRMEGSPAIAEQNPFTDLTQNWYRKAVAWAAENGIVKGVGNGKFAPGSALTKEQLMTILHRYAGWKGYLNNQSTDLSGFEDAGNISGWAAESMKWAAAMQLVSGTKLNATANATRADVAQTLMRFCEAYWK